jgi:nitrile hydratase accessory protein
LSAPEHEAVRPLARRDGTPAFDEPWQAEALAIAHALVERGVFSAREWSAALGDQLRAAEAQGEPDTQGTYYAAAVAALTALVVSRGAVPPAALAERTEAWRDAYRHTPHGHPVELHRS